ncbi:DUF2905 domain-containing protein [Microbulbifer harenosus]|uniref:DUF2905 domain-containing protein n=1 Tax=Microbulbifer harenosus TaxID=2576840 RepID=UPI001FE78CF9|nr:DUF2905 domain-containing protein [Microbulbifer harenosus]
MRKHRGLFVLSRQCAKTSTLNGIFEGGGSVSKWLIILGCALVLVGVLLHFFPSLFSWFGRLPGDIRIESERSRVYFPITSMIIISVVLSVLFSLFRR